jgi:neutral ceramidase
MNATWWAGYAADDITPTSEQALAGFAAREQPALGVHDPLSVRAFAVGDGATAAAIAAVDLIGVDALITDAVRARVRGALGDALIYVGVVGTHTHGGPSVLRRALLGTVDDAYVDGLVVRIADAVVAAHRGRAPVVIRFGLGQERTVGKNRREPDGPIDADLPVVRFDDPERGRARFVLCSYACHPVTLGPGNRHYTRDYPGFLVDRLEHACGAPALFLTGCCGQINTGHSAMDSILGRGLEKRTYAEAERLGAVLAGMAAHTAHRIAPPGGAPDALPALSAGGLRAGSARVRLPLTPAPRPSAQETAALERQAAELSSDPVRRGEAVMAAAHLQWARSHDPLSDHVDTEVALIALGNLAIVLLPGEIFVEFGLELKARFPELHLVTVSYANDAIGYLPHASAFAAGGYEVELAFRHYGFAGPYAPHAGDALLAAVGGLLEAVEQR